MAGSPRIGAYVLAADPTWIRSSVARYYDHLDVLLISASQSNRGWTGRPIAADHCVALVESIDTRRIARVLRGEWSDRNSPMSADTAQRQAAIDVLSPDADWILQIDSDELLPNFDELVPLLDRAEADGIDAVEWPMRVLYRRLRDGRYLEVVAASGLPRYEYPGPIAVRPGVKLADARRTAGRFIRPVVAGDNESVQVRRPAAAGEIRLPLAEPGAAIVHNSWARPPKQIREKISAWGHNQGLRSQLYYYATWLPAPICWRRMRDFHPFASSLWPRLGIYSGDLEALLHPAEHDEHRN